MDASCASMYIQDSKYIFCVLCKLIHKINIFTDLKLVSFITSVYGT